MTLPSGKRPVYSPVLLSTSEQAWRDGFCIPRKCAHVRQLTWLCIEQYLAMQAGTTGLESVTFTSPGPLFREFAHLVGRTRLRPPEAAVLIDAMYRQFVWTAAPSVLRMARRLE